MKLLLEKIDKYLEVQEKHDLIYMDLKNNKDVNEVVDIVKNSVDKDYVISFLDEDMKETIKKMMDGGIL